MSLSSGVLLVSWLLDMAEEMVVLEQISVMMPLHREFVGRVICSLLVISLLPTHRRLLCVPDVCLGGCLWHVVVITVNSLLPTHRRMFRVPDVCNILEGHVIVIVTSMLPTHRVLDHCIIWILGGTFSWLGCKGLGDALIMISRWCHSLYWFLASPRSSIPSSVGLSISHDSLDTETTWTHAYSSNGGFGNTWPLSAMAVPTSRNLSSFLPYGITNLHGVSSTMSYIGCLELAIEPTLLGV
jgi:hypothetical protein